MPTRRLEGALVAGLILIALGVLFLAENFYPGFSAWRLIAHYWPVILIVVGLKKLFDYFTWPRRQSDVPPPPGAPDDQRSKE